MIRATDLAGATVFPALGNTALPAVQRSQDPSAAARSLAADLLGEPAAIGSDVMPQARGLTVQEHTQRVLNHLFEPL